MKYKKSNVKPDDFVVFFSVQWMILEKVPEICLAVLCRVFWKRPGVGSFRDSEMFCSVSSFLLITMAPQIHRSDVDHIVQWDYHSVLVFYPVRSANTVKVIFSRDVMTFLHIFHCFKL